MKRPFSHPLYVQYGAGLCGAANWLNFDASPTLRLQRLPLVGLGFRLTIPPRFPSNVRWGDIIAGLPIPSESCAAMYCSHTLEHLALNDLRKALRNTYVHLQKGGRFRFVLPDLEWLARTYLDSPEASASLEFLKQSKLGILNRPRGLTALARSIFGHGGHLWMWDLKSLENELRDAGFFSIRRAAFGDSGDSKFDEVENPVRWQNCLGIDCLKPR